MPGHKHTYCNIGLDRVLPTRRIIGLFDLDSTTVKKDTRAFLARAQERGAVQNAATDLPVTFVLCDAPQTGGQVLLTSFSLPTLAARVKRRFP